MADGLAADLHSFVSDESLHLAILEMHGAATLETPEDAGDRLRSILLALRQRDDATPAPLEAGIEDPSWDFHFAGHAFFLTVFAPLYPEDHSRFSGEADIAFLLLQPERGFRRFGVSSERPGRRRLSERIHRRFFMRGRPYDLSLNTDAPKSLRYVKPLCVDDPPVRWWRVPEPSTRAGLER